MSAVDFARFVDDLAQASGEAILPFFRSHLGAEDKNRGGAFDPVTEADRAAETIMRRMIEDAFPAHGIIGEEFGSKNETAEYRLGARSDRRHEELHLRAAGLGHADRPAAWRPALLRHDAPAVHARTLFRRRPVRHVARHQPPRQADRAQAAHARCESLAQATLMTTHPGLLTPETREPYAEVEKKVRLSRYGGDCYAYCMVAAGHVDLVIESGLNAYDICALVPIIEGAGGIVTDWSGGSAANGGSIIAAGDKRLHAKRSPSSMADQATLPWRASSVSASPSWPGMKASNPAQNRARTSSCSSRISWRDLSSRIMRPTLRRAAKRSVA